jgi:cytochrome P450
VFDLDLPELAATDPDLSFARTPTRPPTARDHWLVRSPFSFAMLQYDDTVAVLRDKRWHSASGRIPERMGITDPDFLARRRISILSAEGDEHTRLRRLVGKAFSPRAADRLRPFMRDVVNGLVDPVAPTGRADIARDICEPYPIPIICELLGAPRTTGSCSAGGPATYCGSSTRPWSTSCRDRAAQDELDEYTRGLIADRRKPADDLITDLIAAEEEGDR